MLQFICVCRMGNDVSTAAGVVGAVAASGSLALALLYPVTAEEMRNGKYKVRRIWTDLGVITLC